MRSEASASTELLNRAAAGDADAINELFTQYHSRLRAMVRLRMNRRLQGALIRQTSYRRRSSRSPGNFPTTFEPHRCHFSCGCDTSPASG